MINLLSEIIVSLGSTEAQNALASVGERTVKNLKESNDWRNLVVDTGIFFC